MAFVYVGDESIELSGDWLQSSDGIQYKTKVQFPGQFEGKSWRKSVVIPDSINNKKVVLRLNRTGQIFGVLINGFQIRSIYRPHHQFGSIIDTNITPWIKPGEENEIQLVTPDGITANGAVSEISLEVFSETQYP